MPPSPHQNCVSSISYKSTIFSKLYAGSFAVAFLWTFNLWVLHFLFDSFFLFIFIAAETSLSSGIGFDCSSWYSLTHFNPSLWQNLLLCSVMNLNVHSNWWKDVFLKVALKLGICLFFFSLLSWSDKWQGQGLPFFPLTEQENNYIKNVTSSLPSRRAVMMRTWVICVYPHHCIDV